MNIKKVRFYLFFFSFNKWKKLYIGETPYVTKKSTLNLFIMQQAHTFTVSNIWTAITSSYSKECFTRNALKCIWHLIPTSNRENSKAKTTGRIWWEGLFVIGGSCLTWGLLRYPEGSKPVSPAVCGYTHSSPFNRKTKPVTDMLVWDYKDTKQLTKHQLWNKNK